MEPTTPTLLNVCGIGAMLVGRRDPDEATGTYVKTHALTLLFVPLVALGAYRVFDAPGGGWYFRGRVPLSPFARRWNRAFALLALVVLGGGAWLFYTRSENYKAGRVLARADRLAAEGRGAEAAGLYREVMLGPTSRAADARDRFDALALEPPGDLRDAAAVLRMAVALQLEQRHTIPGLYDLTVALALGHENDDPAGALAVLDAVAPLTTKPAEHLKDVRRVLERLVAKSPDDLDLRTRLAAVYAEQGDLKRGEALLAPHESRLGDGDGAALLGRLYARGGQLEKADKLLSGYLRQRLPQLRAAEEGLREAYAQAERRISRALEEKTAEGFDFSLYHASPQADQARQLLEYHARKLKEDATVAAAVQEVARLKEVGPAARDLVLLLTQRAGTLLQGAARDLLGGAIDLKALSRPPGLDLLPYLYRDRAGREPYRARLRAHPGVAKARDCYERLLELSPASSGPYASLAVLYTELGDDDALRRLAARASSARLDLAEYRRQARTRFAGNSEEKDRENLKKALPPLEKALDAARKAGGPTLAAAACRVAAARLAAARFAASPEAEAEAILSLTRDAESAAPSAATRAARIEAHQLRAHLALAKQDKPYAELAAKTARSLGPMLVGWAAGNPGRLRDLALANADVKELLRLTREQALAFPDEAGIGAVALLRGPYPEDAAALSARLTDDSRQSALQAIDRAVAPLSPATIVHAYWWLQRAGKRAEADRLLREEAKKGVPLPPPGEPW